MTESKNNLVPKQYVYVFDIKDWHALISGITIATNKESAIQNILKAQPENEDTMGNGLHCKILDDLETLEKTLRNQDPDIYPVDNFTLIHGYAE
jgi:hypothetical protein